MKMRLFFLLFFIQFSCFFVRWKKRTIVSYVSYFGLIEFLIVKNIRFLDLFLSIVICSLFQFGLLICLI